MEKEATHTHTLAGKRRGRAGRAAAGATRVNATTTWWGNISAKFTMFLRWARDAVLGFTLGQLWRAEWKSRVVCVCDSCQTVRHATRLTNLLIYCTKCTRWWVGGKARGGQTNWLTDCKGGGKVAAGRGMRFNIMKITKRNKKTNKNLHECICILTFIFCFCYVFLLLFALLSQLQRKWKLHK